MRPDVLTVGDGKLMFTLPPVVWFTLKVVATSTVAALVPSAPLTALSPISMALSNVLLAFVNVEPAATVRPPFKVASAETAKVPPSVVAPVLTVSVLLPLIVVLPFSVAMPVPVLNVLLPAIEVLPLSETRPVPVSNVPVPEMAKLPLACV